MKSGIPTLKSWQNGAILTLVGAVKELSRDLKNTHGNGYGLHPMTERDLDEIEAVLKGQYEGKVTG